MSFRRKAFSEDLLDRWWKLCKTRIPWEQPTVRDRLLPRSAAWLVEPGCSCEYRYGGLGFKGVPYEDWFSELTDEVCRASGVTDRPNSCNLNMYKGGDQSVGWHSDDEPLFQSLKQDTLIISLSLGQARKFELAPNFSRESITRLTLRDGDLCTMEGMCQRHYVHRVPKEFDAQGPRINLTWRWIRQHDHTCRAAGRLCSKVSQPSKQEILISSDEDEKPDLENVKRKTARRAITIRKRPLPHSEELLGYGASRPKAPDAVDSEESRKRRERAERFSKGAPIIAKALAVDVTCDAEREGATSREDEERPRKPPAAKAMPRSVRMAPEAVAKNAGTEEAEETEEARRKRRRLERFNAAPAAAPAAGPAATPAAGVVRATKDAPKVAEVADASKDPPKVTTTASSAEGGAKAMSVVEVTQLSDEEKRRRRAARFAK